jgi:Predicted ATPase of the ABC class
MELAPGADREYEHGHGQGGPHGPESPHPTAPLPARPSSHLAATLQQIDGKGYGAYHALAGRWTFPGFVLSVDRVQGDPYASPSKCRCGASAV